MPIFGNRLNTMAATNRLAGRIWLHTQAPTDGDTDRGRTTVGGTNYENGFAVTAGNWSAASNGDINLTVDCAFGTADEDVGTIVAWSFIATGNIAVAHGTLPSTTIDDGDALTINGGTIQLNGSTT